MTDKQYVGAGRYLAAALSMDPEHALYFVKYLTAILLNSLNLLAGADDEADSLSDSLTDKQITPVDVMETSMLDLASYLHYLEVYNAQPIRDRRAVKSAYCTLYYGVRVLADYRQANERMRKMSGAMTLVMKAIAHAFAEWAGFSEQEIRELTA